MYIIGYFGELLFSKNKNKINLSSFIFAFLAVGALAVKLELTDKIRDSISSKLTVVCSKAGGDAKDKAEKLTTSLQSFLDCINPIMDTDTVEEEIKAAKSSGAYTEVNKKYCAKTPELKTCLHTLIDAASPCVVDSAQNQITLAKNSTDMFLDYLCYNDGNRITEFLTENGPECVHSKTDEINACANNLNTQVNDSLENFVALTLTEKCRKFDELTTCIFKTLETCPTPAPGNILESLVAHVRKGSVCNEALPLATPQ